jgi:hypothetical protein
MFILHYTILQYSTVCSPYRYYVHTTLHNVHITVYLLCSSHTTVLHVILVIFLGFSVLAPPPRCLAVNYVI